MFILITCFLFPSRCCAAHPTLSWPPWISLHHAPSFYSCCFTFFTQVHCSSQLFACCLQFVVDMLHRMTEKRS